MARPPIAAETLFVYVGAVTAAWAVVLAALGLSRYEFPGKGAGERLVVAISVLLVVGSIGTAIGTAKQGRRAGEAGAQAAAPSGQGSRPSGEQGQPSAAGPKLSLSADPSGQLRFDKSSLQAKAGSVEIVMSNPSPLSHNISLEGAQVNLHGPTVGQAGTSTVTATLKPGTYTYYCSVPGHREAGMQGTLTVR